MNEIPGSDATPTGASARVDWTPPEFDLDAVTTGDMPGDKVKIVESHIHKATTIFPHLLGGIEKADGARLVVSVCGGSGVGKSEIASILGLYCRQQGFAPYILSGDNYPHRIPELNDSERLLVFRNAALRALAQDEAFTNARMGQLHEMWPGMGDMASDMHADDPSTWTSVYYDAGREALTHYLGTQRESDFSMVNAIIRSFKAGNDSLNLKRMGRTADDIRFEAVDFSSVRVLIIEWTHGNNALLEGVDFPIFLFSTPAETLAHRLARGRDKNADTQLIRLVLEIEQEKLIGQADRAALIVSKDGEALTLADLQHRLTQE